MSVANDNQHQYLNDNRDPPGISPCVQTLKKLQWNGDVDAMR